MSKKLLTISASSLAAIAKALNDSKVQPDQVQLIAPEGKKFTALYWAEAYTGTICTRYLNADGEWELQKERIEDFFGAPLTTSGPEQARKIALEEWVNANFEETGADRLDANGCTWGAYDGDKLVALYWVKLDN